MKADYCVFSSVIYLVLFTNITLCLLTVITHIFNQIPFTPWRLKPKTCNCKSEMQVLGSSLQGIRGFSLHLLHVIQPVSHCSYTLSSPFSTISFNSEIILHFLSSLSVIKKGNILLFHTDRKTLKNILCLYTVICHQDEG